MLAIVGVVNVLPDSVSVPVVVARVTLPVGSVTVPPLLILVIVGYVSVLPESVSVPVVVASVPDGGSVIVPPVLTIVGVLSVLPVSVWRAVRVTRVSAPEGILI